MSKTIDENTQGRLETPEVQLMFGHPFYASKVDVDPDYIKIAKTIPYLEDPISGLTSTDKYILSNREFKNLKKQINEHAIEYFYNIMEIDPEIKFKITTSWINLHIPGAKAPMHHHNNALFSGIVYLQTKNQDSGIFRVMMPHQHFPVKLSYKRYNIYNAGSWGLIPEIGDIYIFPSSLPHKVTENFTDADRYSLAFNFFPVGRLGHYITELEL